MHDSRHSRALAGDTHVSSILELLQATRMSAGILELLQATRMSAGILELLQATRMSAGILELLQATCMSAGNRELWFWVKFGLVYFIYNILMHTCFKMLLASS